MKQEAKMSTPAEDTPEILLRVFSASWCGACQALKKSKLLETFAKEKGIEVIIHDVDEDDEMADNYDVKSIPALFFEAACDEDCEEGDEGDDEQEVDVLAEHTGGIARAQLEKLYEVALEKAAE